MILSFELLGDEHVEIVFDDEARRELIRLLSETEIPGDHFHLFLGEMGGGFGKITEPFNKGAKIISSVCAWYLPNETPERGGQDEPNG